MNKMRIKFFLISFLISSFAWAQHPYVDAFHVEQVAGGVFVQWTLKEGSICQGTQIERRTESDLVYVQIGNIEGVCGNVTEPVSYTFLDTQPVLGSENQYRLVLGDTGATEGVDVFVHDFQKKDYILFQEPFNESMRLLPRKAGFAARKYEIHCLEGKLFKIGSVMNSSYTEISLKGMVNGVYLIVVIEQGVAVFSSTFMKLN
jgi:hypothetical protein